MVKQQSGEGTAQTVVIMDADISSIDPPHLWLYCVVISFLCKTTGVQGSGGALSIGSSLAAYRHVLRRQTTETGCHGCGARLDDRTAIGADDQKSIGSL